MHQSSTADAPGPGGSVEPVEQVEPVEPVEQVEAALQRVAQALRARGERMTAPRATVVRALVTAGGHVGAEEVLARVTDLDPSVHRASVYRALNALTSAGVVHHVHESHGGTVYHLRSEPHLHAQCRACGAVIDVRADLLDGVAGALAAEIGFALDAEHVALSGTCARCR